MKYIILIGDGMSDHPVQELSGRTPLEAAKTLNMDWLAATSMLGLFNSVPEGYPPGSDVANLSIMGYDPVKYYTGRAPLEAASMGIELKCSEVAFRCNLVSLRSEDGSVIMDDYSAGHISTEEAREIILSLDEALRERGVRFYPGKSYRHLMVIDDTGDRAETTPPHDISDRSVEGHLPSGDGSDILCSLMKESQSLLKDHPVNLKRKEAGKKSADSIWLWGQGRAPDMPTIKERYGVEGAIISAVDLMNGIGTYAGLKVIEVPGITGYIDTDYNAKAEYALKALKEKDFICVHVEAPDEAGHQGSLKDKIQAIEDFDEIVVGKVLREAPALGDFRILVLPDHPTPVELKTHTREPVPFILYSSIDKGDKSNSDPERSYSERCAASTGIVIKDSEEMAKTFFAI